VIARAVRLLALGVALTRAGCASSATSESDGGRDAGPHDARADGDTRVRDASADTRLVIDATPDAPGDAVVSNAVLVRLANWSPDAPGLDFCVSPHGSSLWTGPVLQNALGTGVLGTITVVQAGAPPDASADARAGDASVDAMNAPRDSSADVALDSGAGLLDAGISEASVADVTDGSRRAEGVTFPRVSPYVSLTPGLYDVRVVASGSADCTGPLFDDRTDLPAFVAGAATTLAIVGDLVDQGTDPSIAVALLSDDTSVPSGNTSIRFINAVPSVIETSLVQSGVYFTPIVSGAQFGSVGVDTDAGVLDSNDYLALAPVSGALWFVIDTNGNAVLAEEVNVHVTAGVLGTVVAIGGESGPNESAIGVLLCVDRAPIVVGETASCLLLEGPGAASVCPACP